MHETRISYHMLSSHGEIPIISFWHLDEQKFEAFLVIKETFFLHSLLLDYVAQRLDNFIWLWMEKIQPAVSEILILESLKPATHTRPEWYDNTPSARRAYG